MSSKNTESVYIRLSVKDAKKAEEALKKFGKGGHSALKKIETAAKKPTKALGLLDKGVTKATGKMRRMGQVASVINGPLGGIASRFSGLAGLISGAGLAMAGFGLAAGGVVFGLKKSLEAYSQYQRAVFKTEALLKTTASASGLTAMQIEETSVAIGRATLASVAGARAAAVELLTFKSIAGDAFKQTLWLAQDLAAAGFGTLETNVMQLGKALEDPTLGLTMLRRVGVSFTEQQREQIKVMTEAGRIAEAQGEILKVLRDQVGGTGKAEAGGGLAGAFDTLTENVNLFMEAIGRGRAGFFTEWAQGIAEIPRVFTEKLYPDLPSQMRELREEIKSLQAESALLGIDDDDDGLEATIAKKQQAFRALEKTYFAESNKRDAAQKASADYKKKLADGMAFADVVSTVEKLGKERVKAEKKDNATRAAERKRGLAGLNRLEQRAAKATLTTGDYLAGQRKKEMAANEALEKKGLRTKKEFLKAEAAISEFYVKKMSDDRKKQAEKSFGGQAKKQVNSYFDDVSNGGKRTGDFLVGAFRTVEDSLTQFFLGSKLSFRDFWQSIKAGLARLAAGDIIAGIGSALGIGSASAPGGGSVIGSLVKTAGSFISSFFADGGRVTGAGTGTSDSILARISNGEYVVNARATEQNLPLLEAINSSNVAGYKNGGMVANDNLPRFAGGGYNQGYENDDEYSDPYLDADRGEYSISPEFYSDPFSQGYETDDQFSDPYLDAYRGLYPAPKGGWPSTSANDAGPPTRPWEGVGAHLKDFFSGNVFVDGGRRDRTGFVGSGASSGLLSLFSAMLGGLPGMAMSFYGNVARAAATDGRAESTGMGGLAYDIYTGRRSVVDIVDDLASRFTFGDGGGNTLAAASARFGGDFGGGAVAANANNRRQRGSFDASGPLAGLRARLTGDYRSVEATGMSVMRGLRRGGRFAAGEDIVVGEDGPEIRSFDKPGTITPLDKVTIGSNENGQIAELLGAMVDEQRQTRQVLTRVMDQMTAVSSSFATSAAIRSTSRAA